MKFDACVLVECACIFQFSLQVVNDNAHFKLTPTGVSERLSSETCRIVIGIQNESKFEENSRFDGQYNFSYVMRFSM
jgi:hypothetical protein